jgi:DNA-binding winged helix-turn-helix (wHTH) protein/tetratricopeptide (TPR) repeat protein
LPEVNQRIVTFSPFSFDLESGQLHLRGRKIKLPAQNARVLSILIEARGTLVSREVLREKLWPDVDYIDYEHAINKAISQLRTALNDNPRQPRYIETLPRKGYRFAAELGFPVESIATLVVTAPQIQTITSEFEVSTLPRVRRQRISLVWRSALLASVVLIGLVVFLGYRSVTANNALITIIFPPLEANGENSAAVGEQFRMDLSDSLALLPGVKVQSIHGTSGLDRGNGLLALLTGHAVQKVLLLGSFVPHDDRYDVNFEMVRQSDLTHLASLHYVGTARQLRGIREQAQQDIFARLKQVNSGEWRRKGTHSEAAYQAYIDGRRMLTERTDDAINRAVASFKHSIEIDANFSPGYSGLASAYLLLADRDAFVDGYGMARNLARQALQLDESNAEAHAILGCIAMSKEWDSTTAEEELRRAVALDPDEAVYHLWLASLMNGEGKFSEALQQVALAKDDDPNWPPVYQTEAMVAGNAGRFPEAIAAARALVRLSPTWLYAHDELAWAYWYAGQTQSAAEEWRLMAEIKNDPAMLRLAQEGESVMRSRGVQGYSAWRLQHLYQLVDSGYHARSLQKVEWLAYSGKQKEVLASIGTMVTAHDPATIQIGVDPAFASYRNSAEFQQLVVRSGLHVQQISQR